MFKLNIRRDQFKVRMISNSILTNPSRVKNYKMVISYDPYDFVDYKSSVESFNRVLSLDILYIGFEFKSEDYYLTNLNYSKESRRWISPANPSIIWEDHFDLSEFNLFDKYE